MFLFEEGEKLELLDKVFTLVFVLALKINHTYLQATLMRSSLLKTQTVMSKRLARKQVFQFHNKTTASTPEASALMNLEVKNLQASVYHSHN